MKKTRTRDPRRRPHGEGPLETTHTYVSLLHCVGNMVMGCFQMATHKVLPNGHP